MSVPLELALQATSPGWHRRDFIKACGIAAAAVGLPAKAAAKFVQNAEAGLKPSVIWLANQECTGCTESLLRTSYPGGPRPTIPDSRKPCSPLSCTTCLQRTSWWSA